MGAPAGGSHGARRGPQRRQGGGSFRPAGRRGESERQVGAADTPNLQQAVSLSMHTRRRQSVARHRLQHTDRAAVEHLVCAAQAARRRRPAPPLPTCRLRDDNAQLSSELQRLKIYLKDLERSAAAARCAPAAACAPAAGPGRGREGRLLPGLPAARLAAQPSSQLLRACCVCTCQPPSPALQDIRQGC